MNGSEDTVVVIEYGAARKQILPGFGYVPAGGFFITQPDVETLNERSAR